MIRLFVAIPVPDGVRPDLVAMMGGPRDVKWSRPENLHLTLRFIGNVDGRTFVDLRDDLANVRAPAFDLRLEGVGQFGEGRLVESLWAGVAASEPLRRLQNKIEQAVQRQGFEPEPRKFHPHVTLGRLRGLPDQRLAGWLTHHGAYRSRAFRVAEFTLYSSFLSDAGAIYRTEAVYPLS